MYVRSVVTGYTMAYQDPGRTYLSRFIYWHMYKIVRTMTCTIDHCTPYHQAELLLCILSI